MAGVSGEVILTYMFMLAVTLETQGVRGADPVKTCLFLESCVLPCSFQAASDEVIHWLLGEQAVHSYYQGQDRLDLQDGQFKKRTALFHDQISRGNASLQLSKVSLQDQGTYKCYASTNRGNQETLIKVIVEAPVRSVELQLSGEKLTCSSRGIYPEPKLLWSSSHHAQNQTHQETDAQGFFSITSSLLLTGDATDGDYICSVSTPSQTRTATWRRQALVHVSVGDGVTLHCNVQESDSQNFNLTWTFNQELILTYTSVNHPGVPQVQEQWRDLVQNVSESGSLQLRRLTETHQGTYTCMLNRAGNTHVVVTDLELLLRGRAGLIAAGALSIVPLVMVIYICTTHENTR